MLNYENYIYDLNLEFLKRKSNGWYNARCNLCGDSGKKTTVGRLWFRDMPDGGWTVQCYNGGCDVNKTTSFENYLKIGISKGAIDSSILDRFRYERKSESLTHLRENKTTRRDYQESKWKPENVLTKFVQKLSAKYFKPIDDDIIAYCEKRKIPKNVYQHFYKGERDKRNWDKMMIMPLYRTSDMKVYGFVGRSITGKDFTFKKVSKTNPGVYNLFNIDNSKVVYILESIIDSLFVDNSIAMLTAELPDHILSQIANPIFVYDNDSGAIHNALRRLREGYKVVLFPDHIVYKDINEIVVKKGYDEEEIKRMIVANTYEGISGIIRANKIIQKNHWFAKSKD